MYAETKIISDGKEFIVSHVFPPVPTRDWDYVAMFAEDKGEEGAEYGMGSTPEQAIQNLLDWSEI